MSSPKDRRGTPARPSAGAAQNRSLTDSASVRRFAASPSPATRVELERDVQAKHDDYWEYQKEAARGKSVVLVEGDDDAAVLGAVFKQRRTTWEVSVRIIAAGGRSSVLSRLSTFSHAVGLVDRDTWTDGEIDAARTAYPTLHVTAGWCMENLFLSPRWLREFDPRIAEALAPARESWVRAGALWWCLQRAREAQQEWQEALGWHYGSPHLDLDVADANTLAESLSRRIPEAVRMRSSFDVDRIGAEFDARCREVLSWDEEAQWQIGVHGKSAFRRLLVPEISRSLGRQGSSFHIELAEELGRPAPLDVLIAQLLP